MDEISAGGFRSDFLALWLRQEQEADLLRRIRRAQLKARLANEYPLKLIDMPIEMPSVDYNQTHLYRYRTFLRSDHSSFWFASKLHGQFNLPSVLFTDLGKCTPSLRLPEAQLHSR